MGADAIVGHGPHLLQPIEVYNDKPIFYSLGDELTDVGVYTNLIYKRGCLI